MAGKHLHKACALIVFLSLTLQGFAPFDRGIANAVPAQPGDVNSPVVQPGNYQPPEFARREPGVELQDNSDISSKINAELDFAVPKKQIPITAYSYQSNSCVQPPIGLIDWWTADGDWNDIIGGHHGTPQGGITFAPGKVGQAFSFDGIDDYIDLGSWFTYQDFTITMWVNPGSTQKQYADIMDNNHRANINWVVQQIGSVTNQYAWGQTFNLTSGQWQHLAVVHDSSGNYREYLNGNLSGSYNGGVINYTSYNYLLFGRWGGGEGRNWKGLLDEVDVYDRALSQAEIASLFNAGEAGKCKESSGPPSLTIASTYYMDSVRTSLTQNATGDVLNIANEFGFVAGDEVLVMAMKGVQAGQYETAYVGAVFPDRLELTGDLVLAYDTTAGPVMVQKIPHLGAVTVALGGNITAHPWDGTTGGVVFFRAESVVVLTGGKISVSGLGYRGGNNARTFAYQGESYPGLGSTSMEPNGGGGGAGRQQFGNSGGGGGGGYGTNGANGGSDRGINYGRGGVTYGTANLDRLYLGSGGGGGAGYGSASCGAPGGTGGGALVILAESITVVGGMEANGNNGGKSPCDGGGGGGGSGGSIYLSATNLVLNANIVRAIGGAAGLPGSGVWGGGKGGIGRIRLDYSFLSGTTNPPPGYTQTVSPTTSEVTASPTSAPADGQTPITVTVTARDINNNLIQGANVILQSTGNVVITQPTSPTNSQGKASGQIVNSSSEAVAVSATVNGVLLEGTVNLTFNSGDLSLTMTAPESAVANSTVTYTLTVRQSNVMAAENVILQLQLPAGVAYINQNSPVTPTQNGQTLTWSLGTIAPGSSLSFVASGHIPASTAVGETLGAQANVASSTPEVTLANNTDARQIAIVDGYSFTASIPPVSQIFSANAAAVYKVLINNTGLLPDTFALSVTGLEAGWYSLSQSTVTLASGGSTQVDLIIQPLGCPPAGGISFTVTVSGASRSMPLVAQIDFQSGPVLSGLRPGNGFLFGSRNVSISWSSDSPSTGVLKVYPLGQPGSSSTYQSEISSLHSIEVNGLERNATYEWYVQATSDCGSTASTPQQFKIGNGVVFKSHDQAYTIPRDYDQTVLVPVTNQDSVARNVHLRIEEPYEDLLVNFRGSGSIDGDVTLLPGETRSIELAFFAQDAEIKNYDINAVLTSTDGADTVSDLAVIHVKVLFPGDYTIQEISVDPVLNIATYRLTNLGLPITDLDITAEDPITHLPASVMITPQIYHARVGTGQFLDFRVIPLYSAEQAIQPVSGAGSSQGVLARPSRDAINDFNFNLVTQAANVIRRTLIQKNCAGNIYAVTFDGPISVSLPYNTWYCPNREHVKVVLSTPPFVDAGNLLGGMLQMGFSPASVAAPHTVSISLNGDPLGSMQGIPRGMYSFNLSPASINTGFFTSARQTVAIDAHFANFAHYQIGTGGNLTVVMDTVTVFVCANSAEEARQIAIDTYGLAPAPNSINLQIELPNPGATAGLDEKGMINVRAFVSDNLSTYSNIYAVSAEVEYLDQLGRPKDSFPLFDDGETGHGDGTAKDRYFNAQWLPRYGGEVQLSVTAATGYGLTDTDTRTFTVNAQPDFEVKKVFIEKISREGSAVEVWTEIANNGFTVKGPVTVEFRYYNATDEGFKIGIPIYTSQQALFGSILNNSFDHGEVVKVKDNNFVAPAVHLYYVEVVIDP